MKLKLVICLMFFTFLVSSFLGAGHRINAPEGNGSRCRGLRISAEDCEYDRQDALESGCLSQAELNQIISYNGCPVCNRKDKYIGWCPAGGSE